MLISYFHFHSHLNEFVIECGFFLMSEYAMICINAINMGVLGMVSVSNDRVVFECVRLWKFQLLHSVNHLPVKL